MKVKKFHHVGPHLPVKSLRETLDYYRERLGFTDQWIFNEKDGGIRRDDMRLLFAENAEHTALINNGKYRLPLMWYVDNIEEVFEELRNRNIEFVDPLRGHPYGLREFAFIDLNGYYIRVAEAK